MSESQRIVLVSSDNVRFNVSRKVLELSILLKNMLIDLCYDDEADFEIPVSAVNGKTLKTVIEWAEHHKDTVFPDNDEDDIRKSVPLDEWDRKFLELNGNQENLYHVIDAANYLNIAPLINAGCKVVAEMIRGKSPEEIRRTFQCSSENEQDSLVDAFSKTQM